MFWIGYRISATPVLGGSTELLCGFWPAANEDVIETLGDVLLDIGPPEAITDLATTLIEHGTINDRMPTCATGLGRGGPRPVASYRPTPA